MAGNSFGSSFRFTTFGESHGVAIGCVVDGVPPRLALNEADIQHWLDRRRPGQSKFTTQRQEPDQVRILSGVFEGVTTGTPIGFANRQRRSEEPRLRIDQGPISPGPRRFYLSSEIWHSRLSRRWPLIGARDSDAGCGRGDCPKGSGR